MKEIEVKILDIDREKVEKKLVAMRAKKTFDGELFAEYYDWPNRSLKKQHIVLRLRREGKAAKLTFKAPVRMKSAAKVREEKEVTVGDFGTMKKILAGIGLEVRWTMKKRRTTYALGDIRFEFDKHTDKFSWLPEFLEIEGPDEAAVFAHAAKLGFSRKACRPWSVRRVIKHYKA